MILIYYHKFYSYFYFPISDIMVDGQSYEIKAFGGWFSFYCPLEYLLLDKGRTFWNLKQETFNSV